MKTINTLSVVVLVLLLSGCWGNKKGEFLGAINASRQLSVCLGDNSLGLEEWKVRGRYYLAKFEDGRQPVMKLEDLASKGYVENAPQVFNGRTSWDKVTGYPLTKKGEKYFKFGKPVCLGNRRATKVTQYTKPAPNNGVTASIVKFTYETDLNDLSKDLKVAQSIQNAIVAPRFKGNGEAALVETNNGWSAEQVSW